MRDGRPAARASQWPTGSGARDPGRTARTAALVLLAPALPSIVALILDERTILGASVWSKPLKFQLSFALLG